MSGNPVGDALKEARELFGFNVDGFSLIALSLDGVIYVAREQLYNGKQPGQTILAYDPGTKMVCEIDPSKAKVEYRA